VVGIAGAACSGATLGAIEVAKAAGVPMVSYASTSPAITNYDDDGYLFRVVPSDAQQGQALADTYEASGYEYPGIIAMTNDYGAGFHGAFKDNWDGDICSESTYADGTTDFTSQVAAVADNGCDSVVMITYATDGAAIVEEIATQGLDVAIFGGDGIADVSFGNEFTDISAISGITATKPASGADSSLSMLFDTFYAGAAAAVGYEGGIYTRETFDAIAIIGLAQATAYRTPAADDGVKEMLGLTVAGPDAPQLGASGVHVFDENGDVAGSGFDICTFGLDAADNATLDCHSSWGLFDGLTDGGIAKKPVVPGCMDSTANNFNADATEDDGSCTFDADPEANETTDPEPEPEPEDVDEVPGFGLLSAIAAIGVALILRRRL
ncbi:MAG: ABC transporter substrate-binding protein, partial [Dehalococcoidia bacterium]|nr:ABC transporter substrate-binding protein [Dehalococcoidia bacterium]